MINCLEDFDFDFSMKQFFVGLYLPYNLL